MRILVIYSDQAENGPTLIKLEFDKNYYKRGAFFLNS